MTTSKGKRVFTMELVKGSKPSDLVRLIHDTAFPGSTPCGRSVSSDTRWGLNAHVRVLPLTEAAALINDDIKSGLGVSPVTQYVETI